MRLAAGHRLGSYEIVAPLGAGGMGEVYRARDTRLGREVAIKVLPAERIADEGRRRRFVSEAQAASALNHPNIVTIYEIESADGSDFIVMEYVPGRTLAALIPKTGMPVGEALRVAIPVADGLAAAHARGIVHRDLKPANVVVTHEGVVKVLDFGLAKLMGDDPEDGDGTGTTFTDELPVSRPGAITGTAGYMSPEQATGGSVDARSDVFALGAMLYEMVTGRRAFEGRTVSETLAAVVRDQPRPARDLVPAIPEAFERTIARCLRKEPDRRFQHMVDVRVELEELRQEADQAPRTPAVQTRWRAWSRAGLAAGLAAAALLTWLRWSRPVAPVPPRLVSLTALPGVETVPTFSPDGKQVAFGWAGEKNENADIYVKIVGDSQLHRLTTDPARDMAPAWSPDGRQIAFLRVAPSRPPSGSIHLVSALGGPDRKLGDWQAPAGPLSWAPDGRALATPRAAFADETAPGAFGIFLVPVDGAEARLLTQAPPDGRDIAPAFSPDGRHLAYASCSTRIATPCDVFVVDLGPGLEPRWPSRRLTRQAHYSIERIAWMPDGRSLVYGAELGPETFYLYRVGADGGEAPERLELPGVGARFPAIAGERLAFTRWLFDQDIVRFAPGQPPDVFSGSSYLDGPARFSPDGRRVAFESMRSGERMEIWLADARGQDSQQLTHEPGRSQGSPAWSPDGRRIAFDSLGEDGRWNIWTIDVDGGTARRLTWDPGDEHVPAWSRDGRWVYFGARGDGREGIWRIPSTGGVEERVVELGVGSLGVAQESPDGKTLFFAPNTPPFPLLARSAAGGPTRTLATGVAPTRSFAAAGNSLYYATMGPGLDAVLHRLDLASGKEAVLGLLPKFRAGLTVSPDEKTVLFTSVTKAAADIMLVEGFR
jgi:serine/threonine protein kinase/Tol biopolymer transport system component